MKHLLCILFVLMQLFAQAQAPTAESLRKEYYKLNSDSAACAKLYKKTAVLESTDNTLICYKGAISACMANHSTNKQEKIKLFNNGKKLMEQAIAADSSNTELRFLRFTIQTSCPKALGYNKQINNDKQFILAHIDAVKSSTLKNKMNEFLQSSTYLNAAEKQKIKN